MIFLAKKALFPNQSIWKTVIKSGQDEREQMYLFALRMMDARSYDVAQNALLKIKGYKNVDELLKQIEDKV